MMCITSYNQYENIRLPAAIDDGFSSLLWLRDNPAAAAGAAEQWLQDHADFDRIFLIGDSSVGNIVHQVAARAGGIPVHPGFCRARRSRSEEEMPETPFLTLDMMDKFLALSLPEGATKDHPITCPMGEAAPPLETVKLPPYMYCVADQDLMKDTEMEFYEAMKRAGKEVELFVNDGVGHSFYLNKIAVEVDPNTAEQTRRLFEGIKEFINKH